MKVDQNQIVKPTEKPVRLFTRNFVLITIINFATFASNQMFNAALPPYLQGLGTPATLLGFFTAVATIVTLVFRPFIGLWLDRTGRRLIFMIGLAGLLLVSIGYGLTPVIAVIFAIRALHGLVWAAGSTAISTIATDNIPKKRFGEGVAYFGLANSLAIAVAPAIALSLAFSNTVLVSCLLVTGALILAFFMRDNDQRHLPAERAAVAKPVHKGDLMEKTAVLPALIMLLASAGYGAVITFLALYAAERGIANIGIFFTVYAAAMLATRPLLGKIIDHFGTHITILPGLACITLSLILLSRADALIGFLVVAAIYGISNGGLQTSTQTLSVIKAPQEKLGAANATYFMGFDLGIGLGAILSGFFVTMVGYANMYLLFAAFPLLAALLYCAVIYRKRRHTPTH